MAALVIVYGLVIIGLAALIRSKNSYGQGFQHGVDSQKVELVLEIERVQRERAAAIAGLAELVLCKAASKELGVVKAHIILMAGVESGYPRMLALYKAYEQEAPP